MPLNMPSKARWRVSIAKAAMNRNLSDGNFTIDIARTGVRLQGPAKFDGTPLAIAGGAVQAGERTACEIPCRAEARRRRAAPARNGLAPQSPERHGRNGSTYTTFAAGRGEAVATLDLRGASLSIPEASWMKPPETTGNARVVIELEKEAITRLPQIDIRTAGLEGRFALTLAPDRKQSTRSKSSG